MGAPPLGVGQSLPCGDLVLDRKTTWVSANGFFSNDVNIHFWAIGFECMTYVHFSTQNETPNSEDRSPRSG